MHRKEVRKNKEIEIADFRNPLCEPLLIFDSRHLAASIISRRGSQEPRRLDHLYNMLLFCKKMHHIEINVTVSVLK